MFVSKIGCVFSLDWLLTDPPTVYSCDCDLIDDPLLEIICNVMIPLQLKERCIAGHRKPQWKEFEGNEERVEGSKVFLCLRRWTVADGKTARFFGEAQLVGLDSFAKNQRFVLFPAELIWE